MPCMSCPPGTSCTPGMSWPPWSPWGSGAGIAIPGMSGIAAGGVGGVGATAPAGAPAAARAATPSNKILSSSPMAASRVRAATRHYHRRPCPGWPGRATRATPSRQRRPGRGVLDSRRAGGRSGVLEPAGLQRVRALEDRVRGRADVRVDALQVAQHVEMQRARFDALEAALAEARQVALRGGVLGRAQLGFLGD